MRSLLLMGLVLVAALVGLLWAGGNYGLGPVVVTNEYEFKLVLRLGRPLEPITEPGLSLRIPLIDTVMTFDRRLQYLNAPPVELVIANNERLIVDYYVVWRIEAPLSFRRSFPGGMKDAGKRIQKLVEALVGDTIGTLSLADLLARAEGLESLATSATEQFLDEGVRVVDVRINRTELPRKAEPAAYSQMREQRHAISRERRAIGEREARVTRADARREAREIIATATADASVIRGRGDAESAAIYAAAYVQDPAFYAFVRSLEAYRKTLGTKTTFVMPPSHEFFRFLEPKAALEAYGRPAVSAGP